MRSGVGGWRGILASIALGLAGCDAPAMPVDAPGGDGAIGACTDLAGVWHSRVSRCGPAIVATDVTIAVASDCAGTLASPPGKGLPPINGTAVIGADGRFGPADMVVGSNTLSCSGAPDGAARYVIACEPGCTITLDR
jgi:hypothetical protein